MNNTDMEKESLLKEAQAKKEVIVAEHQKKKEEKKVEHQKEIEEIQEDIKIGRDEIKKVFAETIDPNGDNKISLGEILGEMFSITKDVASKAQIRENLVSGGHVSGTNMCLLVLAIFIASIGLNVNSTAVIIGAMLISPLMGTIHAAAYGTATSDSVLTIRSLLGLFMQVFISLCTSTLYYLISPLSDATSELLARTQPTIWDVMIAVCGGLAGIIGVTRKEKTNVIPGVAIATALMPPLCTCGYSIAHGQWKMLLGAGYLFLANSYFIYLSATIILLVLGVPKVKETDAKKAKKLKKVLLRNSIIMLIPGIFFSYLMLHEAVEDESAVIGFETAIDVGQLQNEMEILFPEITSVSVGHINMLDEDGYEMEKKVIFLTTSVDMNAKEYEADNQKIRSYLAERYNEYIVEYEEIDPENVDTINKRSVDVEEIKEHINEGETTNEQRKQDMQGTLSGNFQ